VKILMTTLRNMNQLIHWFGDQEDLEETSLLFSRYFSDLLVNLLHYLALYVLKPDTKQVLTTLLSELFCGLASGKALPAGEVLDALQVDLWRWQQWSVKATSQPTMEGEMKDGSNMGTPFPPILPLHPTSAPPPPHSSSSAVNELVNLQAITETSQAVFEMWLTVAVDSSLLHSSSSKPSLLTLPPPLPLTAVLLATNTPPCYLNGIFFASLKYLQTHANNSQQLHLALTLLTTSLLPLTSHLLTKSSSNTSSSSHVSSPHHNNGNHIQPEMLMLQLLFLMFNLHALDSLKAFHLKAILPILCDVIQRKGFSDPLSLICGKGVTHIARTSPQIFKGEILLVSDEAKLLLQNAMKMILEQQNQQQQSGAGGANNSSGSGVNSGINKSSQAMATAGVGGAAQGGAGGLKKFDMSKFKKAAVAAAAVTTAPSETPPGPSSTETSSNTTAPES
jgi:hypothetical protein